MRPMPEAVSHHRLDGLESDNLLAFLALLGLLRSLDAADREREEDQKLRPRAYWDTARLPLRPVLCIARPATREDLGKVASRGVEILASVSLLRKHKDLSYTHSESRNLFENAAHAATAWDRNIADLLASLISDVAVRNNKSDGDARVDPTPLCLLFGQGHQHFLERLVSVPLQPAPPPRGTDKLAKAPSGGQCLTEALFVPWHRSDLTFSFRWDPEENLRYALMPGDPGDPLYKRATQHGANRLAAVALPLLTLVPQSRAGRVRPSVIGGHFDSQGFSFSWPIWKSAATLSAIRTLLSHPDLRTTNGLAHLGVDHVLTARRITTGNFMNFTRATPEAESQASIIGRS